MGFGRDLRAAATFGTVHTRKHKNAEDALERRTVIHEERVRQFYESRERLQTHVKEMNQAFNQAQEVLRTKKPIGQPNDSNSNRRVEDPGINFDELFDIHMLFPWPPFLGLGIITLPLGAAIAGKQEREFLEMSRQSAERMTAIESDFNSITEKLPPYQDLQRTTEELQTHTRELAESTPEAPAEEEHAYQLEQAMLQALHLIRAINEATGEPDTSQFYRQHRQQEGPERVNGAIPL